MADVTFYHRCVNDSSVNAGIFAENVAQAGSFLSSVADVLFTTGKALQKGSEILVPWTFLVSAISSVNVYHSQARTAQKIDHIEKVLIYMGVALAGETTAYLMGWLLDTIGLDARLIGDDLASRDMQCAIGSYMPK